MTRLRLGVIGAGSWAVASHLPVLAERDEVEFVGVCRKGAAELEQIKRRWGFQVASEDYHEIIAAGIDLAIVSSPSALHFEHAQAALEAGAHVMIEKPFTLTAQDGWELVSTADRLDRHVVVAFGYNYRPMVTAAARALSELGGIGQVESLSVSMASGTRALLLDQGGYPKAAEGFAPDRETWTNPSLSGGGYAQAQLCHALGAALWLTGLRAERVYATMRTPPGARVELNDAFAINYSGGAIGTVSGTSAHAGFLNERDQLHIRAVGDQGHLDIDFERDTVAIYRPDTGNHLVQLPEGSGSYDCIGPPHALVDLALGIDHRNSSPAELGARTAELLEAGYLSAVSGQAESIKGVGP